MSNANTVRLVLSALFLAVVLAACSDSGGSSTDNTSEDPDTAETGDTGDQATVTPEPPGTSDTPTQPGNADTPDQSGITNDADLTLSGKELPRNPVNPSGTPFFSDVGRAKAAAIPDNPAIVYEVVENHGSDAFGPGSGENCSTLGAAFSSCSITNIHIKDDSGQLNNGNWRLYFHSIRRILRVDSDEFSVSFVNGDLNYLEPTSEFSGFNGSVKTVALVTEFSHLIESDFMPRYWLVDSSGQISLVGNTDEETDESMYAAPIAGDNRKAFNNEPVELATAGTRYASNESIASALAQGTVSAAELQSRIIPKPLSVLTGDGTLDIGGGFSFQGTALSQGSVNALQARQSQFMGTANSVPLSATIDSQMATNAYRLLVNANGITLAAGSQEALFHAAQSLLSLVRPGVGTIPYVTVEDAPRFNYRGMHIDVARNFHSIASIRKLLDQMAAYKLNKLHMHLSDDEGWRLEIRSLPELTAIGARRQFTQDENGNLSEASGLLPQLGSGPGSDNQGSGFYTATEFVDLLRYARDRHISIIPEFDMPAHARAAVVAMRVRASNLGNARDLNVRLDDPDDTSRYLTIQHYSDGILNPCLPGTYNFITTVTSDVKALYDQAGVPLDVWHMGGDEANNVFTGSGFQDVNAADKVPFRGEIVRSEWDFPWERSPACASFIDSTEGVASREDLQTYFVKRVSQIVADTGISTLYAYQDIYDNLAASDLATQRAGVGYWEPVSTATGYKNISGFANRGFETVVAVPDFLYFDFPQEVDPEERGYYWATRFSDTRKVHGFAPENLPQNAETTFNREGNSWSATGEIEHAQFVGMQGQLWSETVRTAEQLDYMIFPRLLALAERAWHRASWELDYSPGTTFTTGVTNLVDKASRDADYAAFAQSLALKELPKLDAAGVNYRIPLPGAISEGGVLRMNVSLPGLALEYSVDGQNFLRYSNGASANGVVAIRALSASGSRASRVDAFP